MQESFADKALGEGGKKLIMGDLFMDRHHESAFVLVLAHRVGPHSIVAMHSKYVSLSSNILRKPDSCVCRGTTSTCS